MAGQKNISLNAGHATPKNIVLRALPTLAVAVTTIFLYAGDATPQNIILGDPTVVRPGGPGFPTQYAGLRAYYSAAVRELCLVAEVDAPTGMGGALKIVKNAVVYAVYLVETTDPNATPIRVCTSLGTKAVRLKT